jgi:hypothetical protein
MISQYFTIQRTCNVCGGRMKKSSNRCATCNRHQVPLTAQLAVLLVLLLGFVLFCTVVFYSAHHAIGRH